MNYDYLKDWKRRALERSENRGSGLAFMLEEPKGENDILIDLHVHSSISDGERTIKEIGQQAQNNRVSKLEITDHDTIRPFNELKDKTTNLGHFDGDLINGVEITSKMRGETVHIKVEDFDLEKANELINSEEFPFLNRNFKIRKLLYLLSKRLEIVNKLNLCDKKLTLNDFIKLEIPNGNSIDIMTLSDLGLDLEDEIIKGLNQKKIIEKLRYNNKIYNINFDNFNSMLYKYLCNTEKGKEFLMKGLNNCGELEISFSNFNKYFILNRNSPLYVEDTRFYPTIEQVCDFAKKSGGVAIFAHPYGYESLPTSPEDLMKRAYKAGIDGIECMHGFNEPEQVEKIYKFCYEKGLLISAGTDLHDYYTKQNELAEVGIITTKGEKSTHSNNPMRGIYLGTYNIHYFGSGAWRGEKQFDIDSQYQLGE